MRDAIGKEDVARAPGAIGAHFGGEGAREL
jgi:hypothetical protein